MLPAIHRMFPCKEDVSRNYWVKYCLCKRANFPINAFVLFMRYTAKQNTYLSFYKANLGATENSRPNLASDWHNMVLDAPCSSEEGCVGRRCFTLLPGQAQLVQKS